MPSNVPETVPELNPQRDVTGWVAGRPATRFGRIRSRSSARPGTDRFRDAHSETENPNYRNVDMDL
jgi:hypothetical protein